MSGLNERLPLSDWQYGGSISSGTLLPKDLIDNLLPVLRELNPRRANQLVVARGDDDQVFVVALMDALDEEAPEGAYFGAHPGDGSDFGFWESEDLPDDGHCEVCGSTNRDEEGNLLHTKEECFK